MKLTIDIPDEVYSYVIDELSMVFKDDGDDSILFYLVKGIINGKVLPNEKGEKE